MFIITSTTVTSLGDYVDDYQLSDTIDEARLAAKRLKDKPEIYSWAIAKVIDASEPHWIESGEDDTVTLAENAWGTDK